MIANFYLNKYISEEVQAPTLEEIKTYRKKQKILILVTMKLNLELFIKNQKKN